MVNRDKIEGLLQNLEQSLNDLREIVQQDQREFLRDRRSVGSARYYLQISIESCLGIANHIIASEGLPSPKDYRDAFRVLRDAGILPDDLAQTMMNLAGLRNLLVHQYARVDDQAIYQDISTRLGDFAVFVRHILAFLDSMDATT